jgi:hypothetical protein
MSNYKGRHRQEGNAFRGLIWGLLLSLPIWAVIIWLIVR